MIKKSASYEISQKTFISLKGTYLDCFESKNHKDRAKIVTLATIFQNIFQNHDFPEISAQILK